MSSTTAPIDGDRNRASELNAVAWTWCTLSIICVGLRFYGRIRITRNLGLDDWFILMNLITVIAVSIMWTVLAEMGGCRHLFYLNADEKVRVTRLNWLIQPVAIMTLAFGKISVSFLILRIMAASTWRRWFLNIIMVGTVIFCILASILTFVQCDPVAALWQPTLLETGKAKCWPPHRQLNFSIFLGSWCAAVDLALALLPIAIFWNLQVRLQKKVALCCLMGLGVFACISASVKTTKLPEITSRSDITWQTVTLWIWVANEINVVIVAACIPTLRPLYLIIFDRPGCEAYVSPKKGHPYNSSRTRPGRLAIVGESQTAIGIPHTNDNWLEIPDGDDNTANNRAWTGDITRTIELSVTSKQKSGSAEASEGSIALLPPTVPGGNAV